MSYPSEHRSVVVGTDGSLPARRAVRYAAAEAARRGRPLRIVTATPWSDAPGAGADGIRGRLAAWTMTDTDLVLTEAADLAAEFLPVSEIRTVTAIGAPAAALLDEAKRAELLVVGNRGLGGFSGLLLGSVSVEAAGQAPCPVLIVRHPGPDTVGPGAPVVVGVDGGPRSHEALQAAFRAAELAGAPLLAVHVWHEPAVLGPGHMPAPAYRRVFRPGDEQVLLEAVLAPYAAEHPTVAVTPAVREGHAGHVLIEASAGARLLVLAARGRGELSGLLLGSTSHTAIHHARCPVLVVPANRSRPAPTWALAVLGGP